MWECEVYSKPKNLVFFSLSIIMVSRRKILSRSRDDLNLDSTYQQQGDEEDVWHQKEKLFKVRTMSCDS